MLQRQWDSIGRISAPRLSLQSLLASNASRAVTRAAAEEAKTGPGPMREDQKEYRQKWKWLQELELPSYKAGIRVQEVQ